MPMLIPIHKFPGGLTVLMSIYQNDDPLLFEQAVDSIYQNTLPPNFFILVVDGRLPNYLDVKVNLICLKYNIKLLKIKVNVGLAAALNFGLMQVTTTWVARADADDYNLPDRFALQSQAIYRAIQCVDIIGGAIQEIGSDGSLLGIRRTVENHEDILRYIKKRNPFNHMTIVFRTSFVIRCGGYPSIHLKEDYALWASMLANGAITVNLSNILVLATAGKEMYQRRGGVKYALAEYFLQTHLWRLQIKSLPIAFLHGSARAFVFLLPSIIRGLIYKNFLRIG